MPSFITQSCAADGWFVMRGMRSLWLLVFLIPFFSCTQEQQNRISRSIQNWTGANGVLDVLGGDKILYRFIGIDKLSTAQSTSGQSTARPYRFGYGIYDVNQNYLQDEGEKKLYFEISDYATNYLFYENPVKVKP